MAVQRELVAGPKAYRGRDLTVRFMGPDFLGYVDDMELSGFFLNPEAALAAGERHVDAEEEAKEKAAGRRR